MWTWIWAFFGVLGLNWACVGGVLGLDFANFGPFGAYFGLIWGVGMGWSLIRKSGPKFGPFWAYPSLFSVNFVGCGAGFEPVSGFWTWIGPVYLGHCEGPRPGFGQF